MDQDKPKNGGCWSVIGVMMLFFGLGWMLLSEGTNLLVEVGEHGGATVVHMQEASERYRPIRRLSAGGRIHRVVDGDTYFIKIGNEIRKVRLLDDNGDFINTYEWTHPLGRECTRYMDRYVGCYVWLESGVHYEKRGNARFKKDTYYRKCASIYLYPNGQRGDSIPLGKHLRELGYVKE